MKNNNKTINQSLISFEKRTGKQSVICVLKSMMSYDYGV